MGDSGNAYDGDPPKTPEAQAIATRPKAPQPAVQRAMGWLLNRLAYGPVKLYLLRRECENESPKIDRKQLYDARNHLNIEEYEEKATGSDQVYKIWRLRKDDTGDEKVY
jgi:hypothetical protein